MSVHSEKAGVLPTVIIKARTPTKIESYEWNIQVPPAFFDHTNNWLSLGEHKFSTGSLSKAENCTVVSGNLSTEAKLQISLNMPATDGNLKFRLKPCTIDFMAQGKVLSSMPQYELKPAEYDDWDYDDGDWNYNTFKDCCDLSLLLKASVDKIRITFFIQVEEKASITTMDNVPPPSSLWITAIGKFSNSKLFSDVVICCEDKEFPAHRLVLSMASPVFLKMFQSDTKEKIEGRVVIQDLDKKTVEHLLKWIYSGEVACSDFQDLVSLFKAGHKYCIGPLTAWTSSQIIKDYLTLENALEILDLGYAYEEITLIERTKQRIKIGKQQLFKDWDVYQGFLQRYPEFIQELLLQ